MRCHLRILNGIHADASCELRDAPLVVGSDRDVDIALLDDGLAGRHVSFQRLAGGTLQIAALADGVLIDGVPLAVSQERELSQPGRVTVGGVAFELVYEQKQTAPPRAVSTRRISAPMLVGGVGVVLAVLAARLAIWPAHGVRPVRQQDAKVVPTQMQMQMQMSAEQTDASRPNAHLTDAQLGSAVVEAFRAGGVGGLKVEARAGVVGVSGRVRPQQWETVEKVEQWFDRVYGQRYVITYDIRKSDPTPFMVPVQSVWDGNNPSIVVKGQRYTLGTDVMTGYRLASVSDGRIVFLHDGDRIVVPY